MAKSKKEEVLEEVPEIGTTEFNVDETVKHEIKYEVDGLVPIKEVEELSTEQKILNFIESRNSNEVLLNDFLKSLFPIPKFNEPPLWLNQGECKRLKLVLEDMNNKRLISIVSNAHVKLGKGYHSGDDQRTSFYNLNTVQIYAIKK